MTEVFVTYVNYALKREVKGHVYYDKWQCTLSFEDLRKYLRARP